MKNINSSEQLNELFTALAKAQGEMSGVPHDKTSNRGGYSTYKAMIESQSPVLSKYGLSVCFIPHFETFDILVLEGILGHSSGQWITGKVYLDQNNKANQSGVSGLMTTAQRNLFRMLTGCPIGEEEEEEKQSYTKQYQAPRSQSDPISIDQVKEIEREIKGYSELRETLLNTFKVNELNELTQSNFSVIRPKLSGMVRALEDAAR